MSIHDVPQAIEAFRAAVELDPAYAPAHAGLALAHCAQAQLRLLPPYQAYIGAKAAALRALALDSASADAQVALGAVSFFSEWHWAGAQKCFERALELNSGHTEARLLYGQLLEALGRLDDGLAMKMKALERDPFSPAVHLQISLSYWHQHNYDQAIEWAQRTLDLNPRHPHAREHLAGAYWKQGDLDRHLEENLKHAESHGVPLEALDRLKQLYASEGRAGLLRLALERASRDPDAFPAMQLALFHAEAGNLDAAFRHLERAIESHDPSLVHLAVAPQWDQLRCDPRFAQCLAKMGLRPQAAM
jgi:tetratricopeptide (TPR) repeat protein